MELASLSEKINECVRVNQIEEAIECLDISYLEEMRIPEEIIKTSTLVSARYNRYKVNEVRNTISFGEKELIRSQINNALLEISYEILALSKEREIENSMSIGEEDSRNQLSVEMYQRIKRLVGGNLKSIQSTERDFVYALKSHSIFARNWSKEIMFRGIDKTKRVKEVYIDLDYYFTPISQQHERESRTTINLFDTLNENSNYIILGQPGAGKTTTLKRICANIIDNKDFLSTKSRFPIVIRLRDLNTNSNIYGENRNPLIDKIFQIFGLSIKVKKLKGESAKWADHQELFSVGSEYYRQVKRIVIEALETCNTFILLDGFDEAHQEVRRGIIKDLEFLTLNTDKSRIIMTSRIGEFNMMIPNSSIFEICPLNSKQKNKFIYKWLDDNEKAKELISKLEKASYYDSINKPLILAHVCSLFAKYGSIPIRPSQIYRKIVNLLIEEWDEQRNITRVSVFSNFDNYRKLDFLTNLAFDLTVQYNKVSFSKEIIQTIFDRYKSKYQFSDNDFKIVLQEIESQTGLFIQVRYKEYEFIHKTIHEYLTALYLIKLPRLPEKFISKIPNELSVAISISSEPSDYFCDLVFNKEHILNHDASFFSVFLIRLIEEKPNFNFDLSFGLAFLWLFTLLEERKQINKNEYDLSKILDNFFDEFKIKDCAKELLHYYYIDEGVYDKVNFLKGKNSLIKLTRVLVVPKNSLFIDRFPEYLILRKGFLDKIEIANSPKK